MNAAFFDIFGIIAFLIILIIGIKILRTNKRVPQWVGGLLLLIAIGGLMIDSIIVIKTYILGG